MKGKYTSTLVNTVMLYLLTAAKMIFPLITLPYLARVLTVECYGVVSYVKAVIGYAQIITDFGFMLSAVKEIVKAQGDRDEIAKIIGNTVAAKMMLSATAFVGVVIVSFWIPLLRENLLYVCLSLLVPMLSCFLLDFLFRGIEKMHIITIIFVVMKSVSVALTMIFIRSDKGMLLIPVFDVLSSLIAVALNWIIARKMNFTVRFTGLKNSLAKIRGSVGYFANSMASTAFGALNTVVMGLCITDTAIIAQWGVCMQLIGAVQSLYTPISNGVYPYMIKSKDAKLLQKILLIFMPLILLGTGLCYLLAPWILQIVAGENYVGAAGLFRMLLPLLITSFPVAILGWPALGAINKVKENTTSTAIGAVVQVAGLGVLILAGIFTAFNVAILRNFSELAMLLCKCFFLYKFRHLFGRIQEADQ